jgi:hypothetical protein
MHNYVWKMTTHFDSTPHILLGFTSGNTFYGSTGNLVDVFFEG